MIARNAKIGLVAGLVAYLSFVLVIGFWRTPVDRPLDGSLEAWLAVLHQHGVPGWVDYDFVERVANVGFFIPVGLLLALLLPARRWFIAVLVGVLGSCTIELGQLLFLPARYASWSDVAANSTGTLIGVGIAALIHLGLRRAGLRRTRLRRTRTA